MLQALDWDDDESVTQDQLETLDWDDDEEVTVRTELPELTRLRPPRLPSIAPTTTPASEQEPATPPDEELAHFAAAARGTAISITPIIAVTSDAPPVAKLNAADGRRAKKQPSRHRAWNPRATIQGFMPSPEMFDRAVGAQRRDARRDGDSEPRIEFSDLSEVALYERDTEPAGLLAVGGRMSTEDHQAQADGFGDHAPQTQRAADSVEVDLGSLDSGRAASDRELPPLSEMSDPGEDFTPAPEALRGRSLLGSIPPVSVSDAPPPPPRRVRVGQIASLTMAAACLAIFAYSAYPRTGSLHVQLRTVSGSPASKAEIFIDGQRHCETDPCIVEDLKPGTKTVKVVLPGQEQPRTTHVDVAAGERSVVRIDLPAQQGLVATSQQRDVRLLVDGIDRGCLPTELTDLIAGSHTVRLEATGFVALEREVQIEAGTMFDLGNIELEPARQGLTVELHTEGSRVVLIPQGGKRQLLSGPWPMSIALEPGCYTLVASHIGFAPLTTRFELDAEQQHHEISIDLEPVRAGAPSASRTTGDDETSFSPEAVPAAAATTSDGDSSARNGAAADDDDLYE